MTTQPQPAKSSSVEPPGRVTLWICDRGHIERSTLNGVCWGCYPGGKRTWEPGQPRQMEPNQTAHTYIYEGLADTEPPFKP